MQNVEQPKSESTQFFGTFNVHRGKKVKPVSLFPLSSSIVGARHPDPRAAVGAGRVEAEEAAARRGVQVDAARRVRERDAGDPGEGVDGQHGHEREQQRGAGRENLQDAVNNKQRRK